MRMVDLIEKKKLNKKLTKDEIKFIVSGYVDGTIPDYQVSALSMAICFNGMDTTEISNLTEEFIKSGKRYDLSKINGYTADKHSTGGVGDKTSLVLAPLLAAFDLKVAKISGRGLGQTGGTIDKLESFPGFKVELTDEQFINIVNKCGLAIMAQSAGVVPADKKWYGLRDATATVDSLALISASIMSKKLALGADSIVLDIKCGEGAFMQNMTDAEKLANTMIGIGKTFGKGVSAIISTMDVPLGRSVGNLLEVIEAIKTMQGNGEPDLVEVVATLASISLLHAKKFNDFNDAKNACIKMINSGKLVEIFKNFVIAQGGDYSIVNHIDNAIKVKTIYKVKADNDGYIKINDTAGIGIVAMKLGAGRATKTDEIDHMASIYLNKKTGEYVNKGDTVMTLYTNKELTPQLIKETKNTYIISDSAVQVPKVIDKIIF